MNDRGILVSTELRAREIAAGREWIATTGFDADPERGPDGLAIVTHDPDDPDDDY